MADTYFVAWVLTGVGWLVSSHQANGRESRKETRAEVDACCKIAAELLDKCRRHFGKPGSHADAVAESADISFMLGRLLIRMTRLRDQRAPFRHIMAAGSEMYERVSGGDFGSISRPQYAADSTRLIDIEGTTHRLIDTLESAFATEFRTYRQRVVQWNHKRKRGRTRIRWQTLRFKPGDP